MNWPAGRPLFGGRLRRSRGRVCRRCLNNRHGPAATLELVDCGPKQQLKVSIRQIAHRPGQIGGKSRSACWPPRHGLRRVVRRSGRPPGRKQGGCLAPNRIAGHGKDIAALGFLRQLRSRDTHTRAPKSSITSPAERTQCQLCLCHLRKLKAAAKKKKTRAASIARTSEMQ
jgi:hypothetical protein